MKKVLEKSSNRAISIRRTLLLLIAFTAIGVEACDDNSNPGPDVSGVDVCQVAFSLGNYNVVAKIDENNKISLEGQGPTTNGVSAAGFTMTIPVSGGQNITAGTINQGTLRTGAANFTVSVANGYFSMGGQQYLINGPGNITFRQRGIGQQFDITFSPNMSFNNVPNCGQVPISGPAGLTVTGNLVYNGS
jgi:hypothetical protein